MSTADPVRELMETHRGLCADAVDPIEIAAALEARGLGPGAATRYRHSDVFSLAEELHARAPGDTVPPTYADSPHADRTGAGHGRPLGSARGLGLGRAVGGACAGAAVCAGAAAVVGGGWSPGGGWPVVALLAGLLIAVAFRASGAVGGRWAWPAALGAAGLAAIPLTGALAAAMTGGSFAAPDGGPGSGPAPAAATAVALALGVGSANAAAAWYAEVGRGHLRATGSRAGFRSRMRVVLPVAVLAQLALLGAGCLVLLVLPTVVAGARAAPQPDSGTLPQPAFGGAGAAVWGGLATAGLVLLLAAVLRACGRPRVSACVLLAGAVAAVAAAVLPLPPWLPGGAIPAIRGVPGVAAARSGVAELYGCGAVAVLLLPYVWWVLHRPEAHYVPLARMSP
jgi:hypothetical protein